MSFDEIFDLTAGVYLNFFNNYCAQTNIKNVHFRHQQCVKDADVGRAM